MSLTVDDERMARLPKWAQDEIRMLKTMVFRLEKRMKDGVGEPSPFFVADTLMGYHEPIRYLQPSEHLVYAPDVDSFHNRIQVDINRSGLDNGISVMTTGDPVVVLPRAANAVIIRTSGR